MPNLNSLSNVLPSTFDLLLDALRLIRLSLRLRYALAAENLFLRKQLALYLERQVKPRRAKNATRLTLVLLSKLFAWREALTIVKPHTLIRWHRKGFRLLWRWKSKPRGRPRIPPNLQRLIAEMAGDNPTWGEERIAAELLLKLGIRISPRNAMCRPTEDLSAGVPAKNSIRPERAAHSQGRQRVEGVAERARAPHLHGGANSGRVLFLPGRSLRGSQPTPGRKTPLFSPRTILQAACRL